MRSWSQRARFWSSRRIGLARRPDPSAGSGRLDLHQRDEAVHLRLLRRQPAEDTAEPKRLVAERGPHPVVARGGGVAFVEDEVDDLEHRGEARREVGAARHLEGHLRVGEGPLGPDDPLGDGRRGNEEGARDLFGGQAAEQAKGQRDPGLGREHRVAGGEDQAQEIVSHVVVDRGVEIGDSGLLPRVELVADLLVLALGHGPLAQQIDGAMLGGSHEPGTGIVGHAGRGPPLQGRDQRVLRQVLGDADVAHHPGQSRDEPGRLDAPDGVDRAMGVGERHEFSSLWATAGKVKSER